MKQLAAVLTILFLLLSVGCHADDERQGSVLSISEILTSGGFSGILDKASSIQEVGSIESGEKKFDIYYYAREFSNQRLTQRLLVVEGGKYLGMYALNDKPIKIEGDKILFPYAEENGNSISIVDGKVPAEAFLDGELFKFFK